jgi:hypothetical protein
MHQRLWNKKTINMTSAQDLDTKDVCFTVPTVDRYTFPWYAQYSYQKVPAEPSRHKGLTEPHRPGVLLGARAQVVRDDKSQPGVVQASSGASVSGVQASSGALVSGVQASSGALTPQNPGEEWQICLLSRLDKMLTSATAEKSTSGAEVPEWPSSDADKIGEWLESSTHTVSEWLRNNQDGFPINVETEESDSDSDIPEL